MAAFLQSQEIMCSSSMNETNLILKQIAIVPFCVNSPVTAFSACCREKTVVMQEQMRKTLSHQILMLTQLFDALHCTALHCKSILM